eukprot:gnl/MRDRNA2_/MRDRNA2_102790_c0_seq1.p1 gnl/MRDRNA2_/MRDRNA2_102790_c0~~gnl/MRDRNA2_/MRDRNA2_102790_c0_seq1.p1  ORF type:complete len:726 (+),score=90.36 gnl/MRDRNA2_/MRDRNA2_102790_c0_seq1:1685-3862(+)
MYSDYQRVVAKGDDHKSKKKFWKYVRYRFGHWFAWTPQSTVVILATISLGLLLIGMVLYRFYVGCSMQFAAWRIAEFLIAPDGGIEEETWAGRLLGIPFSMSGLVIFALLLTLLQTSIDVYLGHLREGRWAIMESEHIVLIGLSDETFSILDELCEAYSSQGGTTIAILSNELSKPDMERKIIQPGADFKKSRIVVRAGDPLVRHDLKQVSVDAASTVIVMSDRTQEKEDRDAFVMSVLIGLRSQGWPTHGRIVADCNLTRNEPLFDAIGGNVTDIVFIESFLARLMVQCSKYSGLGKVISKAFGSEGSELYVKNVPEHLVGCSFLDASLYYPYAIIIGVIAKTAQGKPKTHFCPKNSHRFKADEEIVLLAQDAMSAIASDTPCMQSFTTMQSLLRPADQLVPVSIPRTSTDALDVREPEQIIVIGWNVSTGVMLLELDFMVPPSSTMLILAQKSVEERKEYLTRTYSRYNREPKNITNIHHVVGMLGSRFQLEDLPIPLEQASRIFIVADESSDNPQNSDARTLVAILQIRDILVKKGVNNIPVIPEIRSSQTEKNCAAVRACDFIDTSGLPAQVLAAVAYQPKLKGVFQDIISEDGDTTFAVRKLTDYVTEPPPTSFSFLQASSWVRRSGDLLVGWSVPYEDSADAQVLSSPCPKGEFRRSIKKMMTTKDGLPNENDKSTEVNVDFVLNPPSKTSERTWCFESDQLVVLTDKHPSVRPQFGRS